MIARRLLAVVAVSAVLAVGAPAMSVAVPASQPRQDFQLKRVSGAKAKALIAQSGPGLSMACSKLYVAADGSGRGQYFWAISKYGTATCPSYGDLVGTYWTIYTRPTANQGTYNSTRMNEKGASCDGDLYAASMKWCTP